MKSFEMCVRIVLVLALVVVSVDARVVWSANVNSLYKSRSILFVPGANFPNLVESIASGVQMAMDQCQNVFKWDRWNCPQSTFTRRSKQPPNKETAYTKAIIAAGIAHTITKNCSRGEIKGCGCDPKLGDPSTVLDGNFSTPINTTVLESRQEQAWSWGGCSDDPRYALEVTKKFLDGLEKGSDVVDYVGRHNNNVGREIIRDTMVKRCRCHGVSGSCSLQTCWMQVASFEVVSRKLKEKYKKAVRLTRKVVENSIIMGNSARDIAAEIEIPGSEKSLVFLEQSPDYCIPNETEDFPGTKGRTCSRNRLDVVSVAERKSCRNLCRGCGYKVKKIRKEVKRRCNCNFIWCCEVKCETCIETVEEYFCE